MKIAICFYGLVGSKIGKNGTGEQLDPNIAFEYYKKHLFDINEDVDIFIHSWSVEAQDTLVKLYKPKSFIFEKQREFPESKNRKYINESLRYKITSLFYKIFNKSKYEKIKIENDKKCFRSFSRWYSSKQVLSLKKEYEKKNKFVYDTVMVTRLDIAFFRNLNFSEFDMKYFYASNRNIPPWKSLDGKASYEINKQELDTQFFDLWFFSNSKYMDIFSLVFDNLHLYNEISPHVCSKTHVDKYIGKEQIKYIFFRWFDHELIRRKFYDKIEG
jgi:hypothetical protein